MHNELQLSIMAIYWHQCPYMFFNYAIQYQTCDIDIDASYVPVLKLKTMGIPRASYQIRKIASCAWAGTAGNDFSATAS